MKIHNTIFSPGNHGLEFFQIPWKRVLLFFCLAWNSMAWGELKYRVSEETRESTWTIGLLGVQHSLKSGDGNNLLGQSTAVSLGYAKISGYWLYRSSIDVISGPYLTPNQQHQSQLDYAGTGATFSLAYSAEMENVRTYNGNYGFAVGVTYLDIVGRVVGERLDPDAKTDNLVMRATNFGLLPSIFFAWLEPTARKESNHPKELNTRLEGYLLNIGFVIPMIANYTLQYDELDLKNGIIEDPSDEEGPYKRTRKKEKGNLFGFSIAVSFSALLGV